MTENNWKRYRPDRLAGYRLGEVAVAYPDRAIFRAEAEREASPAAFVWLFEPQDDEADTSRVNRFLEATFFTHPNVLKIYGAGQSEETERPFVYVLSEPFETTLAAMEPPRPLNPDTLRPILLPIAAGLEWLHSEGFVYCDLRPDSVARVGREWKLADFSELRVAGKNAPEETRRLLIRRDLYAPPEAYEGVVSPAWDAWSLGQMLHHLFVDEAQEMGRNPRMPGAGAGEMTRELMETDPLLRMSVPEFARRLREARAFSAPADSVTRRLANPVPERAMPAPGNKDAALAYQGTKLPTMTPPVRFPALPEPRTAASPFEDEENDTVWWKRRNRFATTIAVALIAGALVILGSIYQNPAIEAPKSAPVASAPKPYTKAPQTAKATERPRQTPPAEVAQRAAPDEASDKRAISRLLDQWVDATRHHDAYRQSMYYAPVVEEYFGHRNLTAAAVKRAREKIFANSDETRVFSIEDMRVDRVNPDRAVVSFVKIWNFPGRPFVASAREEMTVTRVGGEWKISGEKELSQPAPRRESAGRQAEADRRSAFSGNQ